MAKCKQLAAALVEKRYKCRTDKMYLGSILGYDFCETPHADLFSNFLQLNPDKLLFEQDTVKDRLILWSRGHFKTTATVVEMVQLILCFPDIRILLMQGIVKNAQGLLREVKSHFDGTNFKSTLKDIFPEFCQLNKKLGTSYTFTIPARERTHLKEGTVTIASPRSVKAGQHYDVLFADDLVNDQNFRNAVQLRKSIEDFNLYTPLIDPGGYKYVTGTRYAFGDTYEHIIRHGKNWKISIRQCWTVNSDGSKTVLFPQQTLPDGRTVGFTVEQLEDIQRSDPQMFSCQYLNQPISVTAQQFTEELILSHVKAAADVHLGHATLFIDLATSKGADSDHRVILVGKQDSYGRPYVVDGIGGQWSLLQFANLIIEKALQYTPLGIYIENSAAGVVFVEYLKTVAKDKNVNLPLNFIKVDNRKDAKHIRIMSTAGLLKQDKLFFLTGIPCWEKMFEQYTTYPRNRHDDYPDTVALLCVHYQTAGLYIPKVKSIGDYLCARTEATGAEMVMAPRDNPQANDWGSGGVGGSFD